MGGSRRLPRPHTPPPATHSTRSTGRMGWSVLLLASLLAGPALLQPVEQADLVEQDQMRELFLSVFIDNHRSARDLDEEEEAGEARALDDEEEDTTNLLDEDEDEAENAVEVVSSSDPQEIARFNNYMDAIYRRMNAALRAKLMDPMVLNMNPKEAKKDKKKRVERAVEDDEEEEEDEVDRMGEVEEDEEDDKEEDVEVVEKNKNRKDKKNNKKKERKTKGDRKKKNKKDRKNKKALSAERLK